MILFLFLTGCTIKHDYVWNEYSIKPERISSQNVFTEGKKLKIIKGKASDSNILIGNVGVHHYYGSEQLITNGIVDQLIMELQNRRLQIKNEAIKSLEITVDRSHFERGAWKIAATIEFTVKFGNGTSKSYSVRNSSPSTVDRTYNGAIALAVIEIINDPEIANYINN